MLRLSFSGEPGNTYLTGKMIRQSIRGAEKSSPEGFRYRGLEISRLENMTDAVFGFAITLLVISTEVPQSYVQLQASMYSFIGFVFCTMLLLSIWNSHNRFFQYFGLEDPTTKVLNFLFLFLLLFYVYPLKYLFSFLGTAILATISISLGDQSPALNLAVEELSKSNLNTQQWADLMIRFGLGLFFIYLLFSLMYVHALRQKSLLQLNDLEIFITQTHIQAYLILMGITILSMLIVIILGGNYSEYSGFVYLLIPILLPLHRRRRKRQFSSPIKPEESPPSPE